MVTLLVWEQFYQNLQRTLRVGRSAVEKGTTDVYRVGSAYFEAGFALMIAKPDNSWRALIEEALQLFALAVTSKDCEGRREYPFNLARLYVEQYLGQWILDRQPTDDLLDQSINLYVDAVWQKTQQPLSIFNVLPMGYLLRRDRAHLENFWEMLAARVDMKRLPGELALWYSWSRLFMDTAELGTGVSGQYLQVYKQYCKNVKNLTPHPAKFYLATVKIGRESFEIADAPRDLLMKLAVEPS